ncbi:MAG: phosphotransferase enzyme family protein [Ktedonobacterales bacterium]
MSEPPGIPQERLRDCLQEQYGVATVAFDFLPGGLDRQAVVYRAESELGTPYLLKVSSRTFYAPSCLIPRYLRDSGIRAVVAPIPTMENALWVQLGECTVTVYPFIDGDSSWTGMTDGEWRETGAVFNQIHQVTLPPLGFPSLRQVTFDPAEYTGGVQAIETRHVHVPDRGGAAERALRSVWLAHQSTIHLAVNYLEKLAGVLQTQTLPYVICHADLHPANLLRDHAGHVWVIDWDEIMLAPKERDFIFINEAPAEGPDGISTPPFFQGYGETRIDWIALTYFRFERAVQDVIDFALEVFLSQDDQEEAQRAEAVEFFQQILATGGEIDAAFTAAAHLPPDLIPHTEKGTERPGP